MGRILGWHDVGGLRHTELQQDENRCHDREVVVVVVVVVVARQCGRER
jgi:hypothetical protein